MSNPKGQSEADGRVVPFLKWAGGKRWLTQRHMNLFPPVFERYLEPFLGSAAVFFHLKPKKAILSDVNGELISAYIALRDSWPQVLRALRIHDALHSKKHYYDVRSASPRSSATRAARFLYLNRTCWNGLYRVNLNGKFNVPIGTKDSVLLETDNFSDVSLRLKSASLLVCDFESTIENAKSGDLIFVDPPYTAKHNNNGFLRYNETIFCWGDQIRLRDALFRAHRRGAKFLLTNAYHKSVAELYSGFSQRAVQRHTVISGAQHGRGATEELVVKNY